RHCVAMILSLERRLALTPSVASLQTLTFEILRSVSARRTALPNPPPRRWSRRGRISGRPWRPKLTDSTAPMAPACQSFLDSVVARDQRHLIAELPRRITRERPVR